MDQDILLSSVASVPRGRAAKVEAIARTIHAMYVLGYPAMNRAEAREFRRSLGRGNVRCSYANDLIRSANAARNSLGTGAVIVVAMEAMAPEEIVDEIKVQSTRQAIVEALVSDWHSRGIWSEQDLLEACGYWRKGA